MEEAFTESKPQELLDIQEDWYLEYTKTTRYNGGGGPFLMNIIKDFIEREEFTLNKPQELKNLEK